MKILVLLLAMATNVFTGSIVDSSSTPFFVWNVQQAPEVLAGVGNGGTFAMSLNVPQSDKPVYVCGGPYWYSGEAAVKVFLGFLMNGQPVWEYQLETQYDSGPGGSNDQTTAARYFIEGRQSGSATVQSDYSQINLGNADGAPPVIFRGSSQWPSVSGDGAIGAMFFPIKTSLIFNQLLLRISVSNLEGAAGVYFGGCLAAYVI